MATKSKNFRFSLPVKIAATVLFVILMTTMTYSALVQSSIDDYEAADDYKVSDHFGHNYYSLAERVLTRYGVYKSEENLQTYLDEEKSIYGNDYYEWDLNRDIYNYRIFNSRMAEASSFMYYLENKTTGESYTNMPDQMNLETMLNLSTSAVFESGKVVFPENSRMTELNSAERQNGFTRSIINSIVDLQNYLYDNGDDWYLATAVTDQIRNDDLVFYMASKTFEASKPFQEMEDIIRYISILSALAALAMLVYITFVVGRSQPAAESDELIQYSYDKIPFEIQAAISVVCAVPLIMAMSEAAVFNLADRGQQSFIIFAFVILYTGIIIQYQSLVRNIKASNLWNHVLILRALRWIYKGIKSMFSIQKVDKRFRGRVIFFFIVYVLVFLIGISILFEVPFLGVVILIGIHAFALNWLFKYIAGIEHVADSLKKRRFDIPKESAHEKLPAIFKGMDDDLDAISEGLEIAIHERMKGERLKTELITNVTHDLKNPLTSIISYVTLLQDEQIENDNATGYIEVLDEKSRRLKTLIDQLVEASKASTGNMDVTMEVIDVMQLNRQLLGDFDESFTSKGLQLVRNEVVPPVFVEADPAILYRVMENLMSNINKYSMEQSRVYMDILDGEDSVSIVMKNMSKEPLNVQVEELSKRFVRGDSSRNEEGSGLGLSIALSLAKLIGAQLNLEIDGDLFKSTLVLKKGVLPSEAEPS